MHIAIVQFMSNDLSDSNASVSSLHSFVDVIEFNYDF